MNRKAKYIIAAGLILLTIHFVYYCNKTETVLVSGKVFGFDIQSTEKNEINEDKELIPTALKKIGTITFKKSDNNTFAALGHSIKEIGNSNSISGECYNINLDEIQKSENNNPGKIVAELNKDEKIGTLEKTNNYGVFGKMEIKENSNLVEIETNNRYSIRKGDAEILIDIDGNGLKRYEIEITKINYFHKNQNLQIRIKSQELIEKTGGIIQGMSGAPILQNNKLVGAVNFMSSKDPITAYGIFVDKLL